MKRHWNKLKWYSEWNSLSSGNVKRFTYYHWVSERRNSPEKRIGIAELDNESLLVSRFSMTRDGRSWSLTLVRVYEGSQHGVNSISSNLDYPSTKRQLVPNDSILIKIFADPLLGPQIPGLTEISSWVWNDY